MTDGVYPVSDERVTADTILTLLEGAGLRRTRPRAAIARRLAAYSELGKDFAIEELGQQLRREHAQVGRATLFRAVDTLVELGILDRIELADGSPRYRVCGRAHHHHLICVDCRRIEEIAVCLPEAELASAAAAAGFNLERHSLELYGRCANCHEAGTPSHP